MVLETCSSLAWLAVIVLQYLIHFVIGPRYNSGTEEKCDSEFKLTEEAAAAQQHQTSDSVLRCQDSVISCKNDIDHSKSMEEFEFERHSIESEEMTMAMSMSREDEGVVDPDERDSVDEGTLIRQIQMQETSDRTRSTSNTRCSDGSQAVTGGSDKDRTTADPDGDLPKHSPSRLSQDYRESISDDCIDDDEEWRYKLIQDYYDTSSQSINNMLVRSISDFDEVGEEEDPALQPIGTINTLSEKLYQQRSLGKINFSTQQNSRNVTFDHSPSVISSY
jgi:hypothetical protein